MRQPSRIACVKGGLNKASLNVVVELANFTAKFSTRRFKSSEESELTFLKPKALKSKRHPK